LAGTKHKPGKKRTFGAGGKSPEVWGKVRGVGCHSGTQTEKNLQLVKGGVKVFKKKRKEWPNKKDRATKIAKLTKVTKKVGKKNKRNRRKHRGSN